MQRQVSLQDSGLLAFTPARIIRRLFSHLGISQTHGVGLCSIFSVSLLRFIPKPDLISFHMPNTYASTYSCLISLESVLHNPTANMDPKDQDRNYIQYEELGAQRSHTRLRRTDWADRRNQITAGLVVFVILAVIANAAVWFDVTRGPRDALEENWNHCGRSSEEAMRRGCVMEPLFYGWMPQQCVYNELSDRYPVFEDRKWYLEKELIVLYPIPSFTVTTWS